MLGSGVQAGPPGLKANAPCLLQVANTLLCLPLGELAALAGVEDSSNHQPAELAQLALAGVRKGQYLTFNLPPSGCRLYAAMMLVRLLDRSTGAEW